MYLSSRRQRQMCIIDRNRAGNDVPAQSFLRTLGDAQILGVKAQVPLQGRGKVECRVAPCHFIPHECYQVSGLSPQGCRVSRFVVGQLFVSVVPVSISSVDH